MEIQADPKLLWHVFDNLLNNAMQYTQSGTRIYIDSSHKENEAVIRIRNISSRQLNISPEELMEHFVRGDSSRNTEGSGLGLSIARSLTASGRQAGVLIDGDLFKVILRFR